MIALARRPISVPVVHRLAQDVAGRDLRDPAAPREALGLRAFPAPGGPSIESEFERHDRYALRRPRIRVFFMNPS